MKPSEPLHRIAATATALLFLAAAGAHGQAVLDWCATTLDLPEGLPPPSVLDYQMVERPAASETVVLGVLFLYTDDFTESQVRRRSVEWIQTANQLLNNGTAGYRIVLKRAGVRAAPESVSQAPLSDPDGILDALGNSRRELDPVRSELGADLVTVVAPSNQWWAGFAEIWLRVQSASWFSQNSYNVVTMDGGRPGRAFWEGSALAHEVGHNLGLVHDRDSLRQDGEDPASVASRLHDPHGFGYVADSFSDGTSVPGGINTVMGVKRGRSTRYMQGFSRPEGRLRVVGSRLTADAGDSTTDADRALRKTAATAAAFYAAEPNDPDPPPEPKPDPPPEPDPDPPPEPDPDPPPTGSEPCVSTDGTRYCHVTGFGPSFAVQFFHQGEWRWAEVAVSSGDSAVFHFFGPDNLEVFAKVLNGCAIDATVWVYASGLTDLPIVLHVWPESGGAGLSEPFQIPDGIVLRPHNGARLNWCR